MKSFPFYQQQDSMDCGPACLQMVAAYYGEKYSLGTLRQKSFADREGVSIRAIALAAESLGFQTMAVQMPYATTQTGVASLLSVPLPCIVHWQQDHFVVVYKANKKWVWVADPKIGKRKLARSAFELAWTQGQADGIALLLEPSPTFYRDKQVEIGSTSKGFSFLWSYLRPYRQLIVQLCIGLLIGSVFQLIFPFLTQALVDVGIQNQDIGFVYLILIAQLMLFLGKISVDLIQSWILLHVGTRININLIADFLKKLLGLPMRFFDSKHIGDLLQRVEDHHRVEIFLTSATLRTMFSVFHILIFGIVLLIYNRTIFGIFFLASCLFLAWIFLFLRKRRQIDLIRFEQLAANQNAIIEMIEGAQEIKLQGSEQAHRWEWASIQAQLFQTSMRSLTISQYQDTGANFINQLKDILISFVAAKAVIDGQMTLGMLLAVQFIVGQLSGPLYQLVNFVRMAQDAKISLERLHEIHQETPEESDTPTLAQGFSGGADIQIKNLHFRYNALSDWVLKDIQLSIPEGKTTAIVGRSGSGKTTLVKLLLGFYQPEKGSIVVGDSALQHISNRYWRSQCGAVLQDGYIFSDTIEKNVAESASVVQRKRLMHALKMANIYDFVENLPLGTKTKLGSKGNTISQGQRQRLLLARTFYKNPLFVFFDEATNALDADNERSIMQNMQAFFENKTVIIVAHRLSTVQHADQIVVMDKGKILEIGTHQTLLAQKGAYFGLVKNQLEL